MIKYCCDDCGAELGRWDNIAGQLDMTNHTYCHKCIRNHKDLYKSVVYSKSADMVDIFPFDDFRKGQI
jgi:hypothetical protein